MTPYERKVKPDRTAWRESQPQRCMYCHRGPDWLPLQVHEITPRSKAHNRWWHRSSALLLCQSCHDLMPTICEAQQLAIKLVADGKHFDLDAFLRIKDPELRAPERVTMEDISQFLRLAGA